MAKNGDKVNTQVRRSIRTKKSRDMYIGETRIRQRGTGVRRVKKPQSPFCIKRAHRHGNRIDERQVRQEANKRLRPLIEATIKAQDQAKAAKQVVSKLTKQVKQRDSKLEAATHRITELSKRVRYTHDVVHTQSQPIHVSVSAAPLM